MKSSMLSLSPGGVRPANRSKRRFIRSRSVFDSLFAAILNCFDGRRPSSNLASDAITLALYTFTPALQSKDDYHQALLEGGLQDR